MKNLLMVIVALLALNSAAFGQKEGYLGIFGYGVQIDFSTSPPSISYPSTSLGSHRYLSAWEGTATISDKDGNLLFYTDGQAVWNKDHQVMPNGRSIHSYESSSTTQVLIVPVPGDPHLYYIFVAGQQSGPLIYSLVDLSLHNGLGDVVKKDMILLERATEKLQAVRHATEDALWLITHEYGNNKFKSYYIDVTGINPQYIESAVGAVHGEMGDYSGENAIGYMKVSPSGTKVALAVAWDGIVELMDFNTATGKISNPETILNNNEKRPYGVAFSPDESKLYVTDEINRQLLQYDLQAGNAASIAASVQLISNNVGFALQLGPDDKIYAIRDENVPFLGVINYPNEAGEGCEFIGNGIPLTERYAKLGLPEFPRYPLQQTEGILAKNACIGNEVVFDLINKTAVQSVSWYFGDEASGIHNKSTLLKPIHIYSTSGKYSARAEVVFSDNQRRTYQQVVTIFEPPTVSLGKDTLACNEFVMLNAVVTGGPVSYRWQDGSTNAELPAFQSGKYWVEVSTPYCSATDTIEVHINHTPYFWLGREPVCMDEVIKIQQLNVEDASFLWSDGVTLGPRTFPAPGTYRLTATNRCGSLTREVNVVVTPTVSLAQNATLCEGSSLLLQPRITGNYSTYYWQDGSRQEHFTVSTPGLYWFEVISECNTIRKYTTVTSADKPRLGLPEESICKGGSYSVQLNEPNTTYHWSDGYQGGFREITLAGKYTLTATNECGSSLQQITVSEVPDLNPSLPAQAKLCVGESMRLDVSTPYAQYRWQDGSTGATLTVTQPGSYWVEVYNKCERVKRSIEVYYQNPGDYPFYNFFSPNNDTHNQYFTLPEPLSGSALVIYNRWGKEVFSSHAYWNDWDGANLPAGVYYALLTDKCSLQKITYPVTLLR